MKRKFPLWLLCLILFLLIAVGVYFGIRKAARSGMIPVVTNMPVETFETPAPTPEATAEIVVQPEDPETAAILTEESPAPTEAPEEPKPEETPEPAGTPEPSEKPAPEEEPEG